MSKIQSLIKSKNRVQNYGEVFTSKKEVENMIELLKTELVRPESRFLEPACGDGNFLVEILEKKEASSILVWLILNLEQF